MCIFFAVQTPVSTAELRPILPGGLKNTIQSHKKQPSILGGAAQLPWNIQSHVHRGHSRFDWSIYLKAGQKNKRRHFLAVRKQEAVFRLTQQKESLQKFYDCSAGKDSLPAFTMIGRRSSEPSEAIFPPRLRRNPISVRWANKLAL